MRYFWNPERRGMVTKPSNWTLAKGQHPQVPPVMGASVCPRTSGMLRPVLHHGFVPPSWCQGRRGQVMDRAQGSVPCCRGTAAAAVPGDPFGRHVSTPAGDGHGLSVSGGGATAHHTVCTTAGSVIVLRRSSLSWWRHLRSTGKARIVSGNLRGSGPTCLLESADRHGGRISPLQQTSRT